ncbi:MAG: FMN-binding negative transcriptional regulator [Bacteroidetes bacterium]|nr:FMN-binding negative transcriptional regulator [Bacteroidota bacterium]
MYTLEDFVITDKTEILSFIKNHNFGMLISAKDHLPAITHLPFLIEEIDDKLFLLAHQARNNGQWQKLKEQPECLVVFNGPHTYIPPDLYTVPASLPTWNYTTAHVYGRVTVKEDTETLKQLLHKLISQHDTVYLKRYEQMPDEFLQSFRKHIVGLIIEVERIECKYKLSQNRPKSDRLPIINYLSNSENSEEKEMAEMMKKLYSL